MIELTESHSISFNPSKYNLVAVTPLHFEKKRMTSYKTLNFDYQDFKTDCRNTVFGSVFRQNVHDSWKYSFEKYQMNCSALRWFVEQRRHSRRDAGFLGLACQSRALLKAMQSKEGFQGCCFPTASKQMIITV